MIEKNHRLPPEFYIGKVCVAFTLCVYSDSILLNNDEIFLSIEKLLLQELEKYSCSSPVYLSMKNHIHMIIKGEDEQSKILEFMKSFKQKSGYFFSKYYPGLKWQKDFYDHIIRNEKDIEKHVYYILENPVRSKLIENWNDYKYKGSTMYNLNEWD